MEIFSGTYAAEFPRNQHYILTQDPALINYVLRENHTNYHKSNMTAGKAARLFGKGLLFSNGEYWLRQRRLIQPSFHQKKIQGLYEIVGRTIEEFLVNFPAGDDIDIYPLVHQLSFDIAIRSLFDIELSDELRSELSRIFGDLQEHYIRDVNSPLRRFLYPITKIDRINQRKSLRLRKLILGILEQRRADPREYNDLLDLLLKVRYEDTGEPMAEDQVIDEILILLFAGHETTASTLSWLLYQVAREKEVMEKLSVSIEQTALYDSVKNVYLQAVINESMRLRPAAWATDRVALTDDRFGDYSFPKGTIILPFFYGAHRNKDHWKDANVFLPERFIDDEGKIKKHPAFFPFGAGPRMCIGNHFAMAEMSLFVHLFFAKFRIRPTAQEPVMNALMTLNPDRVVLGVENIVQ